MKKVYVNPKANAITFHIEGVMQTGSPGGDIPFSGEETIEGEGDMSTQGKGRDSFWEI